MTLVRRASATVLLLFIAVPGNAQTSSDRIRLENAHYIVEVTGTNGLISRLFDKHSKTELIAEPRLADNFRLLAPLPDLEGNYILGREQKLTSYDRKPDSIALHWKGPLKNSRG